MRALVIYCHPREDSFTAAVRNKIIERLQGKGAEVRVNDLYARGFDPILCEDQHRGYLQCPDNTEVVAQDVDDLRWCDTLIFVYPTWWYGLPAMLKGWLDRVFLPDVAFMMPSADESAIRPGLHHVNRLGVFTTCGASRWLTMLVGSPGRRTLTRGVGFLCAPRKKSVFAAHYLMDAATRPALERHLQKVGKKMDKLLS